MTDEHEEIITCVYPRCKNDATFDSPTDLCDQHWHEWWDFKIEVIDRQVKVKKVRHDV